MTWLTCTTESVPTKASALPWSPTKKASACVGHCPLLLKVVNTVLTVLWYGDKYTNGTRIPKNPRTCITRTTTSMVGSAPLMNTLIKTQSISTAHNSSVACQFSRTYVSGLLRVASCRTRSETKKHTDVKAAIQPMTVSQPRLISHMP